MKSGDDEGRSFFRLKGVLIGAGILVIAILGSLVYYLFFRPDPVVLAARVVVIPLPTPTVDVIAIENPTNFSAGFPLTTMTYGLTAIEQIPLSMHVTWQERFAEGWVLTYNDGSGSILTVSAIQHYHEEDAIAAFEALWGQAEQEAEAAAVVESPAPSPAPSPSASPVSLVERLPVMSGGSQVGESFKVISTITETIPGEEGAEPVEVTREVAVITWRNTTGVFIMTADPTVIDVLFLEYGI